MNNPKYQNLTFVGNGAMGFVYKAHDVDFNHPVIIKECDPARITPSDFGYDPRDPLWKENLLNDFKKEADTLIRLKHDNVVGIYSFFKEGDSGFLVMEYLDGSNMEKHTEQKNPIPEADVLRCGMHLTDALRYVHKKDIIHRDVKPPNVMKTNGSYVLIDFGIARNRNAAHTCALGTPQYCSIEQFRNQATLKSDVFSAGATLYYVMTGQEPLCPDYQGFEQQIEDLQTIRHGIDPRWINLLKIATAKNQSQRYDSQQLYEKLIEMDRTPVIIHGALPPASPPSHRIQVVSPKPLPVGQNTQHLGQNNPIYDASTGMLFVPDKDITEFNIVYKNAMIRNDITTLAQEQSAYELFPDIRNLIFNKRPYSDVVCANAVIWIPESQGGPVFVDKPTKIEYNNRLNKWEATGGKRYSNSDGFELPKKDGWYVPILIDPLTPSKGWMLYNPLTGTPFDIIDKKENGAKRLIPYLQQIWPTTQSLSDKDMIELAMKEISHFWRRDNLTGDVSAVRRVYNWGGNGPRYVDCYRYPDSYIGYAGVRYIKWV
ncbi:MAG: serine/threonine-protein kinase [Candidatus Aenigmatarchaeota archaeon]